MKTKTFDCVRMKRRGAELVQNKIKDKTPAEQLKFWKQGTDKLKKLQNKVRNQK